MSQDIDWYWHTWRIRPTSEHREIGETHTMETEHREIGETHAMNIRPTSKLPNIEIGENHAMDIRPTSIAAAAADEILY